MRNWQISTSYGYSFEVRQAQDKTIHEDEAQSTRTNKIKRKYFLVSFISYFFRSFFFCLSQYLLALNFLSIAFPWCFLMCCLPYSHVLYFRFLFAWPLLATSLLLLSLLLSILRHFFQTIAFLCFTLYAADIMVDSMVLLCLSFGF